MKSSSIRIGLFLVVLTTGSARSDELWNTGAPLASGSVASVGWNTTATTPFRFAWADDAQFTTTVEITRLTCYGHQTGNSINEPRLLGAYVRILTDNAGAPGDVVWGSWEDSLPFTETFTGVFHSAASNRPIYRVEISLPFVRLCPGNYWFEVNLDNNDIRPDTGATSGNYFFQIATPVPPGANGLHLNLLTGQFFSLAGNSPAFALDGIAYPCATPGDFTGDGQCNPDDAAEFIERLLEGVYHGCVDVNADCEMDGLDVQAFVNACLS